MKRFESFLPVIITCILSLGVYSCTQVSTKPYKPSHLPPFLKYDEKRPLYSLSMTDAVELEQSLAEGFILADQARQLPVEELDRVTAGSLDQFQRKISRHDTDDRAVQFFFMLQDRFRHVVDNFMEGLEHGMTPEWLICSDDLFAYCNTSANSNRSDGVMERWSDGME